MDSKQNLNHSQKAFRETTEAALREFSEQLKQLQEAHPARNRKLDELIASVGTIQEIANKSQQTLAQNQIPLDQYGKKLDELKNSLDANRANLSVALNILAKNQETLVNNKATIDQHGRILDQLKNSVYADQKNLEKNKKTIDEHKREHIEDRWEIKLDFFYSTVIVYVVLIILYGYLGIFSAIFEILSR